MKPIIALVDANNFYVSCERVFDPGLLGRPVSVASNNHGCLVARSAEVKAMGIKMGTPVFKVRDLIASGQLQVLSSNYTLYGDLSSRFHSILEQYSPCVEVYSIDEAFIDLSGHSKDTLQGIGLCMKDKVAQWTGLPICVGISTTKTLAKAANYAAKHYPSTGGVVDLTCPVRQERLLAIMPVDEVWGVGRRISHKLQSQGIETALDLARSNRSWIKKRFSVVLERTVCELQGESCIPFEEESTGNKHQIIVSRSFGECVTSKNELHSALASFASRACEKMREQGKYASEAIIFIRTDPFKKNQLQDCQNVRLALPSPSNNTSSWLQPIESALNQMFKDGYEYKKAGFMLCDLCDDSGYQGDLLADNITPGTAPMMETLDAINKKFGRNSLRVASTQLGHKRWHMKQVSLSPGYTTQWSDILRVKCK